jgi:hypothetical protein
MAVLYVRTKCLTATNGGFRGRAVWNNNCKVWDLIIGNDLMSAFISWFVCIILCLVLPRSQSPGPQKRLLVDAKKYSIYTNLMGKIIYWVFLGKTSLAARTARAGAPAVSERRRQAAEVAAVGQPAPHDPDQVGQARRRIAQGDTIVPHRCALSLTAIV